MAAEKFYALVPGPHGRAASTSGYWDAGALSEAGDNSFAGYPIVPAHFFGPEYSTPAGAGTGGYVRNGKAVTASPVVDLE